MVFVLLCKKYYTGLHGSRTFISIEKHVTLSSLKNVTTIEPVNLGSILLLQKK